MQTIVPDCVTTRLPYGNMMFMADNASGNWTTNPARHFGKQVRKERLAQGWSVHELARQTGISAGHLSRIEQGKKPPTERVAEVLDETFPARRGWFSEYHRDSREWAPPGYRHWREYEDAATHLQVWSPGILHGLNQSEAYARALLDSTGVPAEVVNMRLKGRLDRQRRVLYRDDPPSAWMLVDEMSLLREVGSPEIMTAQMDHLLSVASLPDVTLLVVPSAVANPVGSELIVSDNAAYTEHVAGSYTYVDQETVTALGRLIARLQAESYRASESARMIGKARTLWQAGESPVTQMLRADRA